MTTPIHEFCELMANEPAEDLAVKIDHGIPSSAYKSIRKFYLTADPANGCGLKIIPAFEANSNNDPISKIISDFFAEPDDSPNLNARSIEDLSTGNPINLELINVLIGVGLDNRSLLSKEGPSTFDIDVKGPEVFLLEIKIRNLFIDPHVLSFKDPKPNTHRFYKNCQPKKDSFKRMAFSLLGTQDHKDHLNIGENEDLKGDKFNLHLVYTQENPENTSEKGRYTKIIIDPKARDGGGPPSD
jgi:hypothetical protein